MRPRRVFLVLLLGIVLAWSCPFNDELREYLNARFWLPFARHAASFEHPHVQRANMPYAGMAAGGESSPLDRLRAAYRTIPQPDDAGPRQPAAPDDEELARMIAAARAASPATRDREEIDLIEAKIEMRRGEMGDDESMDSARNKLHAFLRTARTPEFLSESRGWLAHIFYLGGDQTAAGKIYLDELNRSGSNLSRATLLTSLRMTYGYDGGPELLDQLDAYFDTPEHAAFAIQLVTNPRWNRPSGRFESPDRSREAYPKIKALLARHRALLEPGGVLPLLAMRTALRMGDAAGARQIANSIPAAAPVRSMPDFQWMLASACYLSRDFAAAEKPLLALFHSRAAENRQKAAAAYGLCGVYWKTGNAYERLRYALWLHHGPGGREWMPVPSGLADLSVYWASSGWDLNTLLEAEAPVEVLQAFLRDHPREPEIRLVRYSLAVRLTRDNKYEGAAALYREIHAQRRASRIARLAGLYREARRSDLDTEAKQEANFRLAEFIIGHPEGIYFNDALWHGYQRYAMTAASEYRMTGAERSAQIALERKWKDDQEERWRAYLIMRDVARDATVPALRHKAAMLGLKSLAALSDRFGRQEDIRHAQSELVRLLRR